MNNLTIGGTLMNTLQAQNDAFRQGMFVNLNAPNAAKPAGKYVVTSGVHNLPSDDKMRVLAAVRNYNDFNKDCDPYGEHDMGVIELPSIPKVFFRIDYFADSDMAWGAENPAESCFRVLTIMLADEY